MRSALLMLACSAVIFMPGGARAQAVPPAVAAGTLPTAGDPYADPIAEAARRFGIPAAWIRAIMRVESGGDRRALSPKGAMGLMQIMPETWAELRDRYGLGGDPYDPYDNILAGAAYLREMHDRYGSPGFLAAYNAGPARYEEYRDRHRPLPSETLAYVAELLPLTGGDDGAMPIPAAVSDPLAWTRAPIFIAPSTGIQSADRASSAQHPNDTPSVIPVRDLSAIAPQSKGLFVALSAVGAKP